MDMSEGAGARWLARTWTGQVSRLTLPMPKGARRIQILCGVYATLGALVWYAIGSYGGEYPAGGVVLAVVVGVIPGVLNAIWIEWSERHEDQAHVNRVYAVIMAVLATWAVRNHQEAQSEAAAHQRDSERYRDHYRDMEREVERHNQAVLDRLDRIAYESRQNR